MCACSTSPSLAYIPITKLQEDVTAFLSASRTSENFAYMLCLMRTKPNDSSFFGLICHSSTWYRKDAYLVMKRRARSRQLFEWIPTGPIQSIAHLSCACKHVDSHWNTIPTLGLYYLDTWINAPFAIPTTMDRENGNLSGGRCCLVPVVAGKMSHHMRIQ